MLLFVECRPWADNSSAPVHSRSGSSGRDAEYRDRGRDPLELGQRRPAIHRQVGPCAWCDGQVAAQDRRAHACGHPDEAYGLAAPVRAARPAPRPRGRYAPTRCSRRASRRGSAHHRGARRPAAPRRDDRSAVRRPPVWRRGPAGPHRTSTPTRRRGSAHGPGAPVGRPGTACGAATLPFAPAHRPRCPVRPPGPKGPKGHRTRAPWPGFELGTDHEGRRPVGDVEGGAYQWVVGPWPHDGTQATVTLMIGVVSPHGLRRSWFVSVTVGECAGFAAPALTAALLSGSADRVFLPAMLMAGAIEGAVLGFAQARVLRRALDDLPVAAWIGVTAAAAVVAYAIGFAPSQLGDRLTDVPLAVLIPLAAVAAVVLLATIGFAQWTLLRHRVRRAWRWIPITAAAGPRALAPSPRWRPHCGSLTSPSRSSPRSGCRVGWSWPRPLRPSPAPPSRTCCCPR